VTTNPYAPPETDAAGDAFAGAPAQKSFARRGSFLLAVGGQLFFWIPALLVATSSDDSALELLLGMGMLFSFSAHLVGVCIVFAAPRGRRLAPGLLNSVLLTIMVALTTIAWIIGATNSP
jgi:hypothetical protein